MALTPAQREPEFEGGSQPVPERPHDHPGTSRAVILAVVAILAFIALVMPVLWGLGALAYLGEQLGPAGSIALWIVWAVVFLIFVWTAFSLWRRAA
ncbi:MAG TPA: hypothetical protein VKZ58_12490 [Longimicrobiales bacterium]|nr:hypothetical protein [Longimicrobiales bacterium]